jgi:hypothetical protein
MPNSGAKRLINVGNDCACSHHIKDKSLNLVAESNVVHVGGCEVTLKLFSILKNED